MADRNFNIPMGPDRTGQIDLEPIDFGDGSVAEGETLKSFFSDGQPSADLSQSVQGSARPDATWQDSGAYQHATAQGGQPFTEYGQTTPIDLEPLSASDLPSYENAAYADDLDGQVEQTGRRTGDDVQSSLVALGASIKQGRELKSREKEREALAERIRLDREELADRDDILANYQYLVAEQDDIVARNTQEREELKAQLAEVNARTDETSEALSRMRDYHDVQIQPLENALARAQVEADQAKNDERSRKSELGAAETELRRADGDSAAAVARAKVEQIQATHDEARARYESAKDALSRAQDSYDDMRAEFDQAEAPLERALEDLDARNAELKDSIAQLGEVIAAARKRRQYCDAVYERPDETEMLRQDVLADEATIRQMDEEYEVLREQHEESKQKSRTAKIIIAVLIVLVIVIIAAFVVTAAH